MKRDESNGRLIVRFTMVDHDLTVRSGTIGIAREFGTGAAAITKATARLVDTFASTPTSTPPRTTIKPVIDLKFARHCKDIQHQVIIDSASDEVLSSRQMQHGTNLDGLKVEFKNLRLTTLDHCHASSRMTKRTFKVDEMLNDIMENDVRDKKSLCQVIDHSIQFKSVFAEKAKLSNAPFETKVKNLSSAKHRYASAQKPLGRSILHHDALVATAAWIYHKRPGTKEAEAAAAYCRRLSEERFLVKAMMADACDETMALTRFMDDEAMDLSLVPAEIEMWDMRTRYLFDEGGCRESGYTKHALHELKQARVVPIANRNFGGRPISDRMFNKCLDRLKAWRALALEVVRAEWPEFQLLSSFSVFSLGVTRKSSASTSSTTSATDAVERTHVERLARFFKLDAAVLHEQIRDHRPIAMRFYTTTQCTTIDGWRQALDATSRRQGVQKNHPSKELVKVAREFFAYGGSTTGCEQAFARTLRSLNAQQGALKESREEDILKLVIDYKEEQESMVLGLAREQWARYYNHARAPRTEKRLDFMKAKAKISGRDTETSWLRARRSQVSAGMLEKKSASAPARPLKRWLPGHDKETTFQKGKRQKKMFDTYEQGALDQELITDVFKADFAAYETKRAVQDKRHLREVSKKEANAEGGVAKSYEAMVAMPTYVDDSLDDEEKVEVRRWLTQSGATEVSTRLEAKMFVVKRPADAGDRINWIAKLIGGYIVSAAHLRTRRGVGLAFKPAAKTKRSLWISPAFKQKYEGVAACIRGALQNYGESKIKLIDDRGTFEAERARARAAKRNKEVVGLVTSSEKKDRSRPHAQPR